MKFLTFTAIALLTTNAMAKVAVQKCTLAFNQGPFSSFNISYNVDAKNDIVNGKLLIRGEANENFEDVGGLDESLSWNSEVKINDLKEWKQVINFEPRENGDYNSASISFEADDNGIYAMVSYSSDGPSVFSVYRCSDYPFNSNFASAK